MLTALLARLTVKQGLDMLPRMEMPPVSVAWNPFEPGYAENPWPQYGQLLADGFGQLQEGVVTVWRHAHVSAVLRSANSVEGGGGMMGKSMLERDPPDHTRLRTLVSKAFTPRSIAELQPMIETLTTQALDQLASDGGGNLVETVAFPVPFRVISQMLGLPDIDNNEIRGLSSAAVQGLEPMIDMEAYEPIAAAEAELEARIAEVIEWKRSRLTDDMLSAMILAESDGQRLSPEELVSQVILLFVAGHETTVNLIAGGTLALLNDPAQAAMLRDDPELDANAVEELLRYDSPVHITARRMVKSFDLNGCEIPAGAQVLVGLGAANRDPRQYGETAGELNLRRSNAASHLSFSAGIHHCLGSALARLEGRVVIPAILRRFPAIQVAGPVEHNGRVNLRGLTTLTVSV